MAGQGFEAWPDFLHGACELQHRCNLKIYILMGVDSSRRSSARAACASASLQSSSTELVSPRINERRSQSGLADDGLSFSEEFRVRMYEVGPDSRVTMVTIANLLQAKRNQN